MFGQVLGRDKGPLCHDMSFRLVAVARSQQCFASLS